MNQQQKQRFEAIKKAPSKLDQGVHGCCAFAAVLMHAFVTNSGSNAKHCKTIFSGTKFKEANKSTHVTNRVEKRESDLGNQQPAQQLTFDAKLCIGLMITFKEYLKQNNKSQVWDGSIAFSQLFDGWVKGGKN